MYPTAPYDGTNTIFFLNLFYLGDDLECVGTCTFDYGFLSKLNQEKFGTVIIGSSVQPDGC